MDPTVRPHENLVRLPDGTVRQMSPLTGTVVWTVPGRAHRPMASPLPAARQLPDGGHDACCAFCPARYTDTTPEKSRLVLDAGDRWRILRHLPAERLRDSVAEFRRIGNLFPILPAAYWRANHGDEVPEQIQVWAEEYVGTPAGRAHIVSLARSRLAAAGASPHEVGQQTESELLAQSVDLFAGLHDLVVARRHLVDGATHDDELASSGDLTPPEHHAYLGFTLDTLRDLHATNRHVRNVAVFQNWLRPAGASFDHLHKQLVAIDEYGPQLTRELQLAGAEPDLFNAVVVDPAARAGLVVARNDHAVALAGVGHRYPTIEVYSTAAAALPWDHDDAAVRGMSDVLHACHAATGRLVPSNEEWHYRPVGARVPMPWRINLKWRVSTQAGFEGCTKIHITTIDPFTLRDRVVAGLLQARAAGRIGPMLVGDECPIEVGALRYAQA